MTDDEKVKKYRVSYTKVTNNSMVDGNDEFPVVPCYLDIAPDYLCLYGDPKDYNNQYPLADTKFSFQSSYCKSGSTFSAF